MSATMDRSARRIAERAHERARELASESIDGRLSPVDGAWLAEHLQTCSDCRSVAAEYQALHDELRGLDQPQPPRDLWARTSAGLDRVDSSRRTARRAGPLGFLSGSRMSLLTAGAVGFTVMLAAVSLFSNGPIHISQPSTAASGMAGGTVVPNGGDVGPVAVYGNNGYWINSSETGVYQITSSSAQCSGSSDRCAVTNGGGKVLGSIASKSAVSVALNADAGSAAVWTSDKVVVLPLGSTSTVSIDKLTPRPAAGTPLATEQASPPQVTPATSSEATSAPSAPASVGPVAILDGYAVVGRAPEFSPDGVWLAFAARPADKSAGPNIYVWREGWDRALRVTSSGADYFAGWFGRFILITEFVKALDVATPAPTESVSPEETSTPAAAQQSSAFVSFLYDPRAGSVQQIDRQMMLPAVDPTGKYLAYWSGRVQLNVSTGLWEPIGGDLYFDAVQDLNLLPGQFGQPGPVPSAQPGESGAVGPGQLLPVASPGGVVSWLVRWDSTGKYLAVWVGDASGDDSGRVTLFGVDRDSGTVDTSRALLSAIARTNFGFDGRSFVYTSPAKGGDGLTYIVEIPKAVPTASPSPSPSASNKPSETATASNS